MTLEQYQSLMADVKDINEDILYFFTAENTKIMTDRYPKIEFDEDNELLKAYSLHPRSTEEKPIYILSFACTLDSIFAIQYKLKDGIETVKEDGTVVYASSFQDKVNLATLNGNYN